MSSAEDSRATGPEPGRWTWLVTAGVGLALLTLMAFAVPTHVQGGDAGEFSTIMLRGGVPHPSGYPWMRVLGLFARGFEALGLGPATAAALPCAACGVVAWLVWHRLLCAWDHVWSGAFAVTLAASSAIVVLHVNDAEVWGPHLLFTAAFCRYALGPQPPRPLLLGVLLGLSVSHHLTGVLLVPLAVGAAWPTIDHTRSRSGFVRALVRNAALGVGGSLVGLLPWLTLAIGDGGAWRWGDTRSVSGLAHHVLRGDYGVTQLSLHTESPPVLDLCARALSSVGGALSGGLLTHPVATLVLLIGLGFVASRSLPEIGRARLLGFAGALLVCTVGFPTMQNIDPHSPFGAWILERFDLLTVALWAPVIALAVAYGVSKLPHPRLRTVVWLLCAVLLAGQGGEWLTRGIPASERGVETYASDLLRTPEPGTRAVVIGTDDHRSFPILYAQEVLEHGTDVLYIDAQMLAHPWYRARLRQRWPGLPEVDKPLRLIGEMWADPALADTPIYLANVFSKPASEMHLVPEGVLLRVVPPDADARRQLLDPDALGKRHLAALERYQARPEDFGGLQHGQGHPWSADLWHAYVDGSRQLSAQLRATGREPEAEAIDSRLFVLTGAAPLPSPAGGPISQSGQP